MAKVAGGQAGVLLVELAGEEDIFVFQWPYFHTVPPDQIHCQVIVVIPSHTQVSVG